jgi:TonB family protein
MALHFDADPALGLVRESGMSGGTQAVRTVIAMTTCVPGSKRGLLMRILAFLAVVPFCAVAVEPAVPQADFLRVEEVVIAPGAEYFPTELAARGVQGTALVRIPLNADGLPTDAVVVESSRSPDLDLLALARAKTLRIRSAPPSTGDAPAPLTGALVPVEFRKDSSLTLPQKSCGEFNVDLAYFRKVFPDRSEGRMAVFLLTTGMFVLTLPGEQRLRFAKSLPTLRQTVIESCAASPDSLFLDVARGAASELAKRRGD